MNKIHRQRYDDLLKITTKYTKTEYPFVSHSASDIKKTLKSIELQYQYGKNYYTDKSNPKKGGAPNGTITVYFW